MKVKKLCYPAVALCLTSALYAQDELIKFGDFEHWVTRHIEESSVVGGNTKTLMEVGPTTTIDKNEPYVNLGGSPWATSNAYAKKMGVVKGSASVFKMRHGSGSCAFLFTQIERVKALGLFNITALAGGSLFTGKMLEPVSGTSNPMGKLSLGMPFCKRPKAIKLDYLVKLSGKPDRLIASGGSSTKPYEGKDYPMLTCILQKRWEDAKGQIHALRVGTVMHRFTEDTDWMEGQSFTIHYGDITKESFFKPWMGLMTGERAVYAQNSKGKNVKIIEEGWAPAEETPTHAIVKFDSSYDAINYIGSPGNTLCIDNVKWSY